jgi:hypothetical protein
MKTFSHSWQYLAEFCLEWEIFGIQVVEKIKLHISIPVTFSENHAVYENVKKCGGAREAADDNIAVHCMLD